MQNHKKVTIIGGAGLVGLFITIRMLTEGHLVLIVEKLNQLKVAEGEFKKSMVLSLILVQL